jgi:hypothetical protein
VEESNAKIQGLDTDQNQWHPGKAKPPNTTVSANKNKKHKEERSENLSVLVIHSNRHVKEQEHQQTNTE